VVQARGFVSRITHPTNAVSTVVGSEAAPTKLMTAAAHAVLHFACHVVTACASLDAVLAPGTLFDGIEGLQQRHLFAVFRIFIIFRAGAAFVPLTTVRETGLALALEARHDGQSILEWMLLAGATTRPGTPPELLIPLQAVAQQQLIVVLEHRCYCPALHLVMFHD